MATTTIETDLKEVLAKIDNRLERIETTQSELKESIIKIETTSQIQQPYVQKIPDLAEKVGELKNWKQIG
jgi:DNA repair ATPase RecN